MTYKRILVISDLHIPYHHKDSIEFLKEIKKQYKPDFVVNIGAFPPELVQLLLR